MVLIISGWQWEKTAVSPPCTACWWRAKGESKVIYRVEVNVSPYMQVHSMCVCVCVLYACVLHTHVPNLDVSLACLNLSLN